MNKDVARKIIDDIHKVPVFERHIRKCGYYMSDCFYCAPISIWSSEIQVLVDIRRNVFKKALEKFVKEHEDVLHIAYHVSGQDFIPYLCFHVKKEYRT
jgi:hypothetical protein